MDIVNILMEHSHLVPLISFTLLMLAGLNIPISEDVVMIVSGAIAAISPLNHAIMIFIGCFCGAYFSDIIAYLIGRFLLRKIIDKKEKLGFLNKLISMEKLQKAEEYFANYGKK